MRPSSSELLAQYVTNNNAQLSQSPFAKFSNANPNLANFEANLNQAPVPSAGMLNSRISSFNNRAALPTYTDEDSFFFKTAETKQREFQEKEAAAAHAMAEKQYALQKQQAASGDGGSVICTLMHEYGYLEDDVFVADTLFGDMVDIENPAIAIGYHAWAKPFVNFLRNHVIFIPLFAYITQAWAYEMAEQFGIVKNRSTFSRLLGKIVMNAGKPVCGFIGSLILSMQGGYEYRRT
jgi:hypothetical protein